ncbi:UDP-N-acetylenolpyruvoylglucosamine reductase [Ammoniphilus oxalaticus]|uniref:UDP-N-acetylenolpyruvoylglucosamine reductase n=1 Tax=Ammoniphilus oxalaticus TaxID=66863 RepID=A0A419SJ94_9BACL|nr:UDP-N-acetylmuramate dehydrogenase [Ammoniphilus oxalaticus]RKD24101.1 UDP-N-acetylenolpyruvoylglucosamine reductase [Ammoniphilus oxalaticus]
MREFLKQVRAEDVGIILEKEPLANHTTWKIGGPADALIQPKDKAGLVKTMRLIYQHQLPWRVIGRGSNLLVRDKGIRGVVIKLADGLDYLRFEDDVAHVGAGYSFIKLSVMAGKQGLTGLEFAGGIPGTVGGAVYMNAGAHGSDISRVFKSAEVVLETGQLVEYGLEDMRFRYRHSLLQEQPGLVVGITLQLARGDRKKIAEAMAKHKSRRRVTQPLQQPCAGSVFRNPLPEHAGQLIEEAGLKGFKLGGAQVSEKHANFIVNVGDATAQNVLDLIRHIQKVVAEKYEVQLAPEVEVAGEG